MDKPAPPDTISDFDSAVDDFSAPLREALRERETAVATTRFVAERDLADLRISASA